MDVIKLATRIRKNAQYALVNYPDGEMGEILQDIIADARAIGYRGKV